MAYQKNTGSHIDIQRVIEIAKRQGRRFGASATLTLTAGADTDDDITLGNAGYSYSGFKTGDRPTILISRRIAYDGDGVNAYIYRDPTFVDGTIGGTAWDDDYFRNSNDINPKTSLVTINIGLTAGSSTGNLSALGEETFMPQFIFGNTSNQGNGGLIPLIDDPLIMPPNKQYILISKNRSTSTAETVASHVEWVEVDHIPGIVLDNDGNFVSYNGELL